MWQFSQANLDEPITTGLYKYSRHPMQVMYYFMVAGIAIVASNLLFSLIVAAYMFTSYFMFSVQEEFCTEKYGKKYNQYKQVTPRVLFFK